jgi:hypothetical protein
MAQGRKQRVQIGGHIVCGREVGMSSLGFGWLNTPVQQRPSFEKPATKAGRKVVRNSAIKAGIKHYVNDKR